MRKITKETTREQLTDIVTELQEQLEKSEEEKATMFKRLDSFEQTVEKLSCELEGKNRPAPPKLSVEAAFRKNHSKEKYMVHDAIKFGEIVEGKNVVTDFKVGEPFPTNHKLLQKFLESGQVVQVEG